MPNCVFCETGRVPNISWGTFFELGQRVGFCEECEVRLVSLMGFRVCSGCGRDLGALNAAYQREGICQDCERWVTSGAVFIKNRSVYTYNDFLKDVITRFKFRGDALIIQGFRSELQTTYKKWFKNQLAIPIPMSETRRLERTFNQAALIAECLNTKVMEALIRVDQAGKQSKKTRKERLTVSGDNPFQADPSFKKSIEGQAVVLIDDLYTTGATAHLAAQALESFNPKSISSFTLARG